jgi:hypothetical protein
LHGHSREAIISGRESLSTYIGTAVLFVKLMCRPVALENSPDGISLVLLVFVVLCMVVRRTTS